MQKINEYKCFGGLQQRFSHASQSLGCDSHFSIFLPPQAVTGEPVPVLYWLSGLTCTDENFVTKAGAQRVAAELGIAIVTMDTSPRGEAVPDDAEGSYDFGLGAGFYVNATQAPWAEHYRMYDYVLEELPALIQQHFPVTERAAISGHSMGGHGALVLALRNPQRFTSVSAFSPICNPSQVPWGEKAFSHYLGEDREAWQQYDACELMSKAKQVPPMLVEQGESDEFLESQLKPQALIRTVASKDLDFEYRQHTGYDHSYFFIASFIESHLRFHAAHLFKG